MNIIELISFQNPWITESGYIPKESAWTRRDLFFPFFKNITDTKQIISLVGLRRTGKSTLIKQAVATLLEGGVARNRILYFSFEELTVVETPDTLEQVIDIYFHTILNEKIHEVKEPVYLFFDEIQIIPYWQDIVKRYYDVSQRIKFVVSGSSSLYIRKASRESLAGRIFENRLGPLNFSEYHRLSGRSDIEEFLRFGQFPELLSLSDREKRKEYVKDAVVKKVIETDIPKIIRLRKLFNLERLFTVLVANTGQIIKSSKLGFDLAIKKATLFYYLSILEETLLVNKVVNVSGSFRSEKRLLRKYYPGSTNFLTLVPEQVSMGFAAENYICLMLRQKYTDVYLYNYRGREIDFIIPSERLAIEVKYQEQIRSEDYQFLKAYCGKKNYQGIVICKNIPDIDEKSIKFVPLTQFD